MMRQAFWRPHCISSPPDFGHEHGSSESVQLKSPKRKSVILERTVRWKNRGTEAKSWSGLTTNTRIAGAQVGVEREFLHQWEEAAMAYRQGREVGLRCLGETHPLVQALSKSCEAVTGDLAFRTERSVEIEDYVNH